VSQVTVGDSGGNPVAVLIREKPTRIFARLAPTEGRLTMDRTKRFLALALGALFLLPAAAAQAATATPNALSFSSSLGVASAPQAVIYSVTAADPPAARLPKVGIDPSSFESHPFTQTNNCNSLPASGSGQCGVEVTFTPNVIVVGTTIHATLKILPGDATVTSIPYATVSLTGVSPNAGGKGKKCHKKGKKASAAKKCKGKKH
jgi:hypothetical protein